MNWTVGITVALSLVAFKAISAGFKGLFSERRDEVQGADLMAAAVLLLSVAFEVSALVCLRQAVPMWMWPIAAMSVAGLLAWSMRAALGIRTRVPAKARTE